MCHHLHLSSLLMVAVMASVIVTVTHGQFLSNSGLVRSTRDNPCRPTPCGPNTNCQTIIRGVARAECRCLDGFVPDGNTINGCIPLAQCIRDIDCPYNYRCQATKCVRVFPVISGECTVAKDCPENKICHLNRCIDSCAIPNICGHNAKCIVATWRSMPICNCCNGTVGNPHYSCTHPNQENVCRPSPCGPNMKCSVSKDHNGNDQPACSCIANHFPDPYSSGCRPRCVSDSECPSDLACRNSRCENPCTGYNVCGGGALCNVVQGRPQCSCPPWASGSPQIRCSQFAIGLPEHGQSC